MVPLQDLASYEPILIVSICNFDPLQRVCEIKPLVIVILVGQQPLEGLIGIVAADDPCELAI